MLRNSGDRFLLKLNVPFADAGDNSRKFKTARDVPGPFALPILGTRWIYSRFGYYSLNKIHDAYKGKEFGLCPSFTTFYKGNVRCV